MSDLFDRAASLIVEGTQFEGLRMQFKVVRTSQRQPNTAEIVVTHLNEKHRGDAQKRYPKVVLVAGYKGGESQLFSGYARTVDNAHKGTDWETRLQCGDGEKQFVYAKCNQSWGPGTPLSVVAGDLARASGLAQGNLASATATSSAVYQSGFVVNGSPVLALQKVLAALKLNWSIQDGAIQVLQPGASLTPTAVVLSPDSGLVGDPQHSAPQKAGKKPTLKVRSLLQPTIKPGSAIQVESGSISGLYRAERVEHVGDTDGQNWYTDIEAHSLSGFVTR